MSDIRQSREQTNFWKQLDQKVTQLQNKHKGKKFFKPEEENYRFSGHTRPQIEDSYHQQVEEEVKIRNRIKFFQLEKQKNRRNVILAKNKFQKIMEIRNQSVREKKQCQDRIRQTRMKIARDVQTRASKIRNERNRITISVQRVRERNQEGANDIRSLSFENEETIRNQKSKIFEHNRETVEKAHEDVEKSRTLQIKRKEEIEVKGKLEHSTYLQDKIMINQAQHRRNSLLKQKLHESILAGSKEREKAFTELKQYTIPIKQKHSITLKRFNSTHTTVG